MSGQYLRSLIIVLASLVLTLPSLAQDTPPPPVNPDSLLCDGALYRITFRFTQFRNLNGCNSAPETQSLDFVAPMGSLAYQPLVGSILAPERLWSFYFTDGAGIRRDIFIAFCENRDYEILSVEPVPNSTNCCQEPCSEEDPDVRFRFGINSIACSVLDGNLSLANYIQLADGTTYELSFRDTQGNLLGTECGEGEPQVWVRNNDPEPNRPRYRPYRPQPNPQNSPPPLNNPAPSSGLPSCATIGASYNPPAVWNSNNPFDFNDYLSGSTAAIDFVYVQDRKTGAYNYVENPDRYYFNSDGRDEWGVVNLRIEVVDFATGLNCVLESSLEVLDYGLYFFTDQDNHRKVTPDKTPSSLDVTYFDPSKPTILYAHGINNGQVANHGRERLRDVFDTESLLARWRAQGWNVGIFYWTQLSDRDPINPFAQDQIERIINDSEGNKPWRREDGNVGSNDASPTLALKQEYRVLMNQVRTAMNSNLEFRVAGHSMGAQLTAMTVAAMTNNRPDRIALLDPYFTANQQPEFVNAVLGVQADGAAIEYYSSTFLNQILTHINSTVNSYIIGSCFSYQPGDFDELESLDPEDVQYTPGNLESEVCKSAISYLGSAIIDLWADREELQNNTTYVNLAPQYPGATLNPFGPGGLGGGLENKHYAAVDYYFRSITEEEPMIVVRPTPDQYSKGYFDGIINAIPVKQVERFGISAVTCTEEIRRLSGQRFDQIGGTKTVELSDVIFLDYNSGEEEEASPGEEIVFAPSIGQNVADDQPTKDYELNLGNPSDAGNAANNYLIEKGENYSVSYNCTSNTPNWAAYHLNKAWTDWDSSLDGAGRKRQDIWQGKFLPEDPSNLPGSCAVVEHEDYACGGFDRGHLVPSSHRNLDGTGPFTDLGADTYFMSNMLPQNSKNNSKVWYSLEKYLKKAVIEYPVEAYIIAGGRDRGGWRINPDTQTEEIVQQINGPNATVRVPKKLWKVVIILPEGDNDLDRINAGEAVAAFGVRMDNRDLGEGRNWTSYIEPVSAIETSLNANRQPDEPLLTFFPDIEEPLRSIILGQGFNPTTFNFFGNGPVQVSGDYGPGQSDNITGDAIVASNLNMNGGQINMSGNDIDISNTNVENNSDLIAEGCTITIRTNSEIGTRSLFSATTCNMAMETSEENSTATLSGVRQVESLQVTSSSYVSLRARPNPFEETILLEFSLSHQEQVTIQILDQFGRLLATPIRDQFFTGRTHQTQLHTADYPSGVYVVQLWTASGTQSIKIVKQ